MEYFAGLDVSMEETRVCILDRDGTIIHEVKVPSTPSHIEAALAGAPACRRVVFETGRMAPMLHHGLTERGVPIVCIESRQASQALKSLAWGMTNEQPSQSEKETAPPRLEEFRRNLEDYANDLRALIKRLRQKLH